MSLYGDYIKEREGKEIVESGHGFASYKIIGQECHVGDVYIKPEFRKAGIASDFGDEIVKRAREAGCNFLIATVAPSLKGATISLISQLAYGFELHSAHEDFIILKKEI